MVADTPSPSSGDGYFTNERADLIGRLTCPVGRVLDVGCGAGGTAAGLRRAGATEIVGIEIDPDAASMARRALDVVIERPVDDAIDQLDGGFDTVLCLDVLEHLVDPYTVLHRLRDLTRPQGRLQVSTPNARHYSLMRDLLVRGTFGYADWGHRDRTHLRWFTRSDLVRAVGDAGWRVTGTGWPPLGRSAGLHRISRGRSSELLVAQIYVAGINPG